MSIFATLITSTTALRVFERALSVVQNNVGNASTPGYARQRMDAIARPFDPAHGLAGGVHAGEIRSARNGYAEQYVRRHTELSGYYEQSVGSLTAIENVLTLSGESGIPVAITRLLEAFSAWGQDPNSQSARREVLDRTDSAAYAFRHTVAQLVAVRQETDTQIRNAVDEVNTLAGRLEEYNRLRRSGERNDAGLDARIHATLEELSGLVDFSAMFQEDGTVTVLLGGQSLLVVGENAYGIRDGVSPAADATYPGGASPMEVFDSNGTAIAGMLKGGKLGALLDIRNRVFPSLIGDSENIGSLNVLAATFAVEVNEIIEAGEVRPGEAGAQALFYWDESNPTGAAESIRRHDTAAAANLPAIQPGTPGVSNGIPLQLAALTRLAFAETGDLSFIQHYGAMAASVGRELERGEASRTQQLQFAAQARAMRDAVSGVSLDEEAVLMLEYQRAYQATARVIATLTELTEETINMLR